jgi:hypothetical protein
VGLVLLAAIWISTAVLQVPCHRKLTAGYDPAAARRLVAGQLGAHAGVDRSQRHRHHSVDSGAKMSRDMAFKKQRVRGAVDRLAVVFADQLDLHGAALANLDKQRDAILMMEIADASRQPPSHRQRTVLFLSAMRHFARELAQRKYRVHYIRLNDADNTHNFDREIARAVAMLKPNRLDCTEPGDWRVREQVESAFDRTELPWEIHEDAHFLVTRAEFAQWMDGRNQPVMEHFYRAQRKKLGVLMRADGKPEGGEWNYDQQNRNAFKSAPDLEKPYTPRTDAITREVMALVNEHLPDLPENSTHFSGPSPATRPAEPLTISSPTDWPALGLPGCDVDRPAAALPFRPVCRPQSQAAQSTGVRRRSPASLMRRSRHRSTASRDSSASSSDGASSFAASIGTRDLITVRATRSTTPARFPICIGPVKPRWPACTPRWGRLLSKATAITFNG